MKKYKNPFKNKKWNNPGKTFEESCKRVKLKANKIKERMRKTDFEAQREDDTLNNWQSISNEWLDREK